MKILDQISTSSIKGNRLTAVLLDPDRFPSGNIGSFLSQLPVKITHIFIGGSQVAPGATQKCIRQIRRDTTLPVVIFPGDQEQISDGADGLLFLSLISGRNPEYLIGQQIVAARKLTGMSLDVIPTGYILVDGGTRTAVERVSGTRPISQREPEMIVNTALAGQFLGHRLIYLEAGSGAKVPVAPEIISAVKQAVAIPVVVGGGIRSASQYEAAWEAGADMVVIGTAFENQYPDQLNRLWQKKEI